MLKAILYLITADALSNYTSHCCIAAISVAARLSDTLSGKAS